MITKWDLNETNKKSNIRAIERNDLLSFWRNVNVHCYESFIDESMKRDHVLITSLNPESDSHNRSFVLRLVRKSYLFHSLNLEACSLHLIEWDRTHIVERWIDISVYLFQRLQMLVVNEILFFRSEDIKRREKIFIWHKWFTLLQFWITHLIFISWLIIFVAKLWLNYAFEYDLCCNVFLFN
jgi:hypothetical protein